MKNNTFILLFTLLLVGCNSPNTMEEVFHNNMKSNKDVDDYKIVEIVREDNIIIFTSHSENEAINEYHNNEQPKLAYFTRHNDEWIWSKTGECPLDKWSANLVGEPYLWCGTLTEPRHEKVVVGDNNAKIIEMSEAVSRTWYHLSEKNNEEVKVILKDGSEEWLKEVRN
ncbi:hypothetical protein ACJA3J_08210 [Halobacillus sp. SY10]|uniref:hypothetical protein n=1 Tax=Halobacillus sp. SY10 TaxID=3381356 RepID=UPI0038797E26